MTYQQPDMYSRTGAWIVDTARRKPEALLLMAAGCALLMRAGRRPAGSVASRMATSNQSFTARTSTSTGLGGEIGRAAETASGYAHDAAEKVSSTAKSYATNVADTVTDYADAARRKVSDYADDARRTAGGYADDARRNISQTSERLMGQAESTYHSASDAIRGQPVLVAALGLAAGAAVAALFPATEVERRTLGVASDALASAAAETGEKLIDAAGKAGEHLKDTLAERGLDSGGLKDMAREVADTFTSAAAGKTEQDRSVPSKGTQSSDMRTSAPGGQPRDPGRSAAIPASQTSGVGSNNVSDRSSDQIRSTGSQATETAKRSSGNVPGRS